MVFSGIPFLFVFSPVLLIVYRLVPATGKNAVLLLFSLLFYFYGEGSRILIMLVTITVNFLAGIGMERYPTKRRWLLGIALVYDLGQLVLFKYTDFLIDAKKNSYSDPSIRQLEHRSLHCISSCRLESVSSPFRRSVTSWMYIRERSVLLIV